MLLCRGFKTKPILPLTEAGPAALEPQDRDWDILLTAETHNFPCAVAPYPGLVSLSVHILHWAMATSCLLLGPHCTKFVSTVAIHSSYNSVKRQVYKHGIHT